MYEDTNLVTIVCLYSKSIADPVVNYKTDQVSRAKLMDNSPPWRCAQQDIRPALLPAQIKKCITLT